MSHEAREALEALDIRAYDIKHQEFEYTSYLGASGTFYYYINFFFRGGSIFGVGLAIKKPVLAHLLGRHSINTSHK